MRSLVYVHDPLCGWCYAITGPIARLRAAGVAVSLQPSGLFSTPGRRMTPEFAAHAWRNDLRIAELTGRVFSAAYRERVLGAVGAPFDSRVATLALTAVAATDPDREADALRVLQEARYVAGRDVTDAATVRDVLGDAGFGAAAAVLADPESGIAAANADRVAAGRALLRELGASGVPTLVLVDGLQRQIIDTGLLHRSPDAVLALFDPMAAA